MVVVEVRQGTLGGGWSWLRSDREHCASRVAVEQEDDEEEDDEGGGGEEEEEMRRRGGEEEQATDIKSNNPHLAGGEKNYISSDYVQNKYNQIIK